MKYLLLLAVVLAFAMAQAPNSGRRSGTPSRSRSVRPQAPKTSKLTKRDGDWSGEDFWAPMMYWRNYGNYGRYPGNYGGNYGGNMQGSGVDMYSGNMRNNYGDNQGGNYGGNFGGRSRPYSSNNYDGGWGWGGPSWYMGGPSWYGGWGWGGNSGEWFSDRLGVAAPTSSRRSASAAQPNRRTPAGLGRSRV